MGIARVQPPAGLWGSASVGRRAAQGVKGDAPLARAVIAENFADGNGFCKHGCRACLSLCLWLFLVAISMHLVANYFFVCLWLLCVVVSFFCLYYTANKLLMVVLLCFLVG